MKILLIDEAFALEMPELSLDDHLGLIQTVKKLAIELFARAVYR